MILFMKILFIDVQGNGFIKTSFSRPPRLPSPHIIQMFLSKLASGELVCGGGPDPHLRLICMTLSRTECGWSSCQLLEKL